MGILKIRHVIVQPLVNTPTLMSSPQQKTYYFGRLNTLGSYVNYDEKNRFFITGIRSGFSHDERQTNWAFTSVSRFTFEEELYLTGYLAKYRDDYEETIDSATGEIGSTLVEDAIISKARFFIHVKSGIIAFNTISRRISRKQFARIFCELFKKGHDYMMVDAELQIIEEPFEFFGKIDEFDRIDSIKISLHPANPDLSDLWESVHNDMVSMDASNYYEEYRNTKASEGLNADRIKHEMRGKLHMALDGYGEGKISGYKGDEYQKISTSDNPSSVTILERESHEETFDTLKRRFKEIFDKFKSQDRR